MSSRVDVLAIGAHPDDVELSAGGVISQLASVGARVAIVDCTEGEMGSRGSIEIRREESANASIVLGVLERVNLGLPDGFVQADSDAVREMVRMIRHYQPRLLLFPPERERHPDHEVVHRLVRTAYFNAGLHKYITTFQGKAQEPSRPEQLICYMQSYHFEPQFIVDITGTFEQKLRAVECYSSQIFVPGKSSAEEPETFISSQSFRTMIEARARYFGSLIGAQFGEGFYAIQPIGMKSLAVWL